MSAQPQEDIFFQSDVVIERPVNSESGGPFAVYSPGRTLTGLKGMVHFFNTIPGGAVFEVTSGKIWLNQGQLPENSAQDTRIVRNRFTGAVMDKQEARSIPAEITLNALLGDRSLTIHGLSRITQFDSIDADIMAFNQLILPVRIEDRQKYGLDDKISKIIDDKGVLFLRRIWLEQALEGLRTGRILEDVRRKIEVRPYLQEVWREAIEKVLLPANEQYETIANTQLAAVEERIRAKEQKVYDPYAHDLMWLLGRKPERTALSRTLEASGKGSGSGIGAEEIKTLVTEIATKLIPQVTPPQVVASRTEEIQCPDCGEFVKMMATGGPPRKCRHCGYIFLPTVAPFPQQEQVPVTPIVHEPIVEDAGVIDSPTTEEVAPIDDEEIAAIAARLVQQAKG